MVDPERIRQERRDQLLHERAELLARLREMERADAEDEKKQAA